MVHNAQPPYLTPALWGGNPFGNAFGANADNSGSLSGGNSGGGINMFSDADIARTLLINVGHISATAARRLETANLTEFLNLGALLSTDGAAASQFVQYYYQGFMSGLIPAMGTELRGLYNVITNAGITDQDVFNKVAKVFKQYIAAGFDEAEFTQLIANQALFAQVERYFQDNGRELKNNLFARKHINLMTTNSEYATFMQEDGYPSNIEDYVKAYIYDDGLNNCWCDKITYSVQNRKLTITSSYTIGGNSFGIATSGHIAVVPQDHPDRDYLTSLYIQIKQILAKPDDASLTWVYELQGLGINPDNLLCKSCDPPKSISLNSSETYKFGITQDVGGFSTSMDARYTNAEKQTYGITNINFWGVTRPNANILAVQQVSEPVYRNHALLLEKILIFNYILTFQQQIPLRVRGIRTKNDLPPGNAIGR